MKALFEGLGAQAEKEHEAKFLTALEQTNVGAFDAEIARKEYR